jgi:copper ion binding protein
MASTVEHVTLTAPDISCGHCVATVQEAVGGLAGVASVQANESTKQVEIAYDPNRVSLEQIEQRLDDAGYPVAK